MDTLLIDGDHYTDGRGLPVVIDGDAELIQRALIRLTVRRGALEGAPGLGSELYKLYGARQDALDRLALSYVQEALAPMTEITVEDVGVEREGDVLKVSVTIAHRQQAYILEVNVS